MSCWQPKNEKSIQGCHDQPPPHQTVFHDRGPGAGKLDCAICHDEISVAEAGSSRNCLVLWCNHAFHAGCIRDDYKIRAPTCSDCDYKTAKCPYCRRLHHGDQLGQIKGPQMTAQTNQLNNSVVPAALLQTIFDLETSLENEISDISDEFEEQTASLLDRILDEQRIDYFQLREELDAADLRIREDEQNFESLQELANHYFLDDLDLRLDI